MSKQEAIQKAYGEHWELVKETVNENGWFDYDYEKHRKIADNIPLESYSQFSSSVVRPKSLQGIENNNGWIKIHREEDIPKELIDTGTEVFLSRNKIVFIGYFYKAYGGLNYNVHNLDSTPKEIQGIHMDSVKKLDGYQLIIKPQPSIY